MKKLVEGRQRRPTRIKVYQYEKCSTCKNAVKFLERKKIPYDSIPIKETPPPVSDLKKMVAFMDGNFKKLFNTSGIQYREMGLSEKLKTMTEEQALKLLSSNGMLVKRPFVLGEKVGLVGFKEAEWKKL